MNVKDVVTILQPLEGYHVLILTNAEPHGFVHGQPCVRVQDLPLDQRQPDQGNVILWDAAFTAEGLQSGGTFWAKNVRSITWHYNTIARIDTRDGIKVSFIKLWKLQEGN